MCPCVGAAMYVGAGALEGAAVPCMPPVHPSGFPHPIFLTPHYGRQQNTALKSVLIHAPVAPVPSAHLSPASKFVVGSSSARIPQFRQKVSASARRMTRHASTCERERRGGARAELLAQRSYFRVTGEGMNVWLPSTGPPKVPLPCTAKCAN